MEKERMELFEQKLFSIARRDDVERMRQEFLALIRRLKEEQKESALRWLEGVQSELEGLKREAKVDLGPIMDGMNELGSKIEALLFQMFQSLEPKIKEVVASAIRAGLEEVSLGHRELKEEIRSGLLKQEGQLTSSFRSIQEEERATLHRFGTELKTEILQRTEGFDQLKGLLQNVSGEIESLNERVRDGFLEVREELGAMIKFSYADLDKRITALEARVKALEKKVLPSGNL
ncbi:MAG: hypothetical protein N3G78_03720 [Desulfobacterota bacterium]|nr:hypothetical protein [Thermodesulfobacteriota bacterium]